MQKVVVNQNEQQSINSQVNLTNRNNFSVTGVTKVVSSNEQCVVLQIDKTAMYITGSNLHISRLDVSQGIVEGDGWIDGIKYNKSTNLFKKLFK